MIEFHQQGRRQHVLVDDEGWAALRSPLPSLPDFGDTSPLLGVDVYRDECPCTENVECRTCQWWELMSKRLETHRPKYPCPHCGTPENVECLDCGGRGWTSNGDRTGYRQDPCPTCTENVEEPT